LRAKIRRRSPHEVQSAERFLAGIFAKKKRNSERDILTAAKVLDEKKAQRAAAILDGRERAKKQRIRLKPLKYEPPEFAKNIGVVERKENERQLRIETAGGFDPLDVLLGLRRGQHLNQRHRRFRRPEFFIEPGVI